MGWTAWLLGGLAGAITFLGLSFLSFGQETGAKAWLWQGGLSGLAVRVGVALLVAHVVFWWRASEQSAVSLMGFGVLAGTVFFMVVLDARLVHPLRPLSNWAQFDGTGAEQAGRVWEAFRAEAWRWPWAGTPDELGVDLGDVTRGGAIPLMAVPAKAAAARVSIEQYFGIWLLLCYALQGLFAALLMRCLTYDPRLQMLGVGLFLLSPVLLNSTVYPATAAHGLLLAGLWLYFRTAVAGRQGWAWIGWGLLGMVTVAVQGQLALMVLLLGVAYAGRCVWVDRTVGAGRSVLGLGGMVLAMCLVGYLCGYSDWGSVIGAPGETDRGLAGSMNLAGPVDPAGWSSLLRPWSLPGPQASVAFAYFGAGVLVLALWCWLMMAMRPLDASGFRPWIPVLGLGGLLSVVALLPRVAVGPYVILDLSGIADWLGDTGMLGASARYFWLVNYALLFLLIALVVHAHPPRRAVLLLAFVLMLQTTDLRERLAHFETQVHGNPPTEASASLLPSRYFSSP